MWYLGYQIDWRVNLQSKWRDVVGYRPLSINWDLNMKNFLNVLLGSMNLIPRN